MSRESLIKGIGHIVSAGIGIIHNCSSCRASVSLAISRESERDYRFRYCIDSDVTGFDITACNLLKNMHRLVLMTTNLVNV